MIEICAVERILEKGLWLNFKFIVNQLNLQSYIKDILSNQGGQSLEMAQVGFVRFIRAYY